VCFTRFQLLEGELSLVTKPNPSALVIVVCFRVSCLKNLGSLWLAPSPFVLGFPRTLGSLALKTA
jgi:hypothetical protein